MIYFIQDQYSRAVKIGVSDRPLERLGSLQVSCPGTLVLLGTISGGRSREEEMHARFTRHHLRGEWFSGNDRDFLCEIHDLIGAEIGPHSFSGCGVTIASECAARGDCRYGLAGVRVAILGKSGVWVIRSSQWGVDQILQVNTLGIRRFLELEAEDEAISARFGGLVPADEIGDRPVQWIPASRCMLVGSWPGEVRGQKVGRPAGPDPRNGDLSSGDFWGTANRAFDESERRRFNEWRGQLELAWFALADSLEIIDGGGVGPWADDDFRKAAYDRLNGLHRVIGESPDMMTS